MKHLLNQFTPVVLETPCKQWESEDASRFFHLMCRLKMRGYGANYPAGVLPLDTTDFISSHILICRSSAEGLVPVMGYKTVEAAQCEKYRMDFPGLSLVQRAGAADHTQAVKEIMHHCQVRKQKLAYLGSWTVDPEVEDKAARLFLRELFCAVYTNHYLDEGIHNIVIGGTLRFKTEKIFSQLGHSPLSLNGRSLPPIPITHLQGEQVSVMHAARFSPFALESAKKYEGWWRRKKTVFSEQEGRERLRPAA